VIKYAGTYLVQTLVYACRMHIGNNILSVPSLKLLSNTSIVNPDNCELVPKFFCGFLFT